MTERKPRDVRPACSCAAPAVGTRRAAPVAEHRAPCAQAPYRSGGARTWDGEPPAHAPLALRRVAKAASADWTVSVQRVFGSPDGTTWAAVECWRLTLRSFLAADCVVKVIAVWERPVRKGDAEAFKRVRDFVLERKGGRVLVLTVSSVKANAVVKAGPVV